MPKNALAGLPEASVPWADLDVARRPSESCRAFVDPAEADDRGIRLRLWDIGHG
jgi:hypothetical protein